MVHVGDTSPKGLVPLTEVIANIWKLGVRRDTVMLESSFRNVDIRMLRNAALDVVAPEERPPSFETARGVLYCWQRSIPGLRTCELQYFMHWVLTMSWSTDLTKRRLILRSWLQS
jgi:hypothetical protein